MILESDIRLNASRVLDGSLSFDDFEDWLVSTSWNMHKDSSERAQEMVASIELSIFEKDMDGVMDILRSIQDPKNAEVKA